MIAAGVGYASVNLAAAGFAGLGLVIAVLSGRLDRRRAPVPAGTSTSG
ncbi:MAG: hypothetical protein JOZ07_05170 [Solirubrobacterales bacterium]|nr:hypothetical protein [Solirubrobacterales bacterium]